MFLKLGDFVSVKCTVNGKSLTYDASESITIPSKSADILLVLDESKDSEPVYRELVTNSMAAMKKALTEKGIRCSFQKIDCTPFRRKS